MKIKKLEYTDKGYSYIKCTKEDCLNWGGMSICDSCNSPMNEEVYLIYILGQAYCSKCFKKWIGHSKKYKEDLYMQKQNQERWYKAYGFQTI